jgi:hypothetical protein
MNQSPYPEYIMDRLTGEIGMNPLYVAWHEGFETHKLEILTKFNCTGVYMRELIAEARKISELKRTLKNQSVELEQKNSVILKDI